jgi:OOP family OmpA-OmpF porin
MKKTIYSLFFLFTFTFYSIAQERSTDAVEYNRLSIEGNVGVNKPDDNFTSGYNTSDPNTYLNVNAIRHYDLGVRYMFNEYFGLKLDAAYDIFKPESGNNSSKDFLNRQYRLGLQGVVNLRNILDFNSFSKRLGLLVHAGLQASRLDPQTRTFADLSDLKEDNGGYMFGITPQFKLSNRFAVTLDLTYIQNLRQNLTWGGDRAAQNRNLKAELINTSIGLTYYIGKNDVHADWVDNSSVVENSVDEIQNSLDKIKDDLKDTDKDGVADYLDREPNTTNGVAVNTKGESIDLNQNGIPDELESSLERMYVSKELARKTYGSGVEGVKPDANDDLINVYFKFGSTQPEYYSLNAITQIVKYMKTHPEAKAILTGYTDQIGTVDYNDPLSESRAKKVYDIVIAAGVDESRLSYKGGGIDDSSDKSSEEARQMVRRVTFELK